MEISGRLGWLSAHGLLDSRSDPSVQELVDVLALLEVGRAQLECCEVIHYPVLDGAHGAI